MLQIFENKKKKMISLDTLNKVSKTICKLIIKNDKEEWTGNGFFMSIKFENEALINCLVTNYHIINENVRGGHVRLQIGDDKKDFNIGKKRYIKYFEKPIDFTIIEILSKDEFIKDVNFLSSDLNYIKYGYDYYLNKEIFILQHPYGEEMYSAIGKIINMFSGVMITFAYWYATKDLIMTIIVFLILFLMDSLGEKVKLLIDLERPKINWDNEYTMMKEHTNVMYVLFYTLAMLGILFGIALIIKKVSIYLATVLMMYILFNLVVNNLIRKNKNKIFSKIY